jgi:hypothetical protein
MSRGHWIQIDRKEPQRLPIVTGGGRNWLVGGTKVRGPVSAITYAEKGVALSLRLINRQGRQLLQASRTKNEKTGLKSKNIPPKGQKKGQRSARKLRG